MAQITTIWTRREDLIFEGYANLNGSGNWASTWMPDGTSGLTTSWYDSTGIDRLRIVANLNSLTSDLTNFSFWEADYFDTANAIPLRWQPIPVSSGYAFAELVLSARLFQFTAAGYANDSFFMSVRAV